jgi:hypothetical protein
MTRRSALLTRWVIGWVLACCLHAGPAFAHDFAIRPWSVEELPLVRGLQAPSIIPPLPSQTRSLRFEQFFRLPVGPLGLEPSADLLAAHGQRVRLFGYMVLSDSPRPGTFLMAALPVTLAEQADGQADDLPPAVVTVRLPAGQTDRPMPYVPGILMLEGRLEVGLEDEPDGRRSLVRLAVDWPPRKAATITEKHP